MVEEELVTLSARVQKSQAKEIERLAAQKGLDKSTIIRQLLTTAIQKQRLEEALDQVRTMKITVWKAAEIAGVTYREMLKHLKTHNIPFPLTPEGLQNEIRDILTPSHK